MIKTSWICPLALGFLLTGRGAESAFPTHQPGSSADAGRPSLASHGRTGPLHMNLPVIQGFRLPTVSPTNLKTTKGKQLWYRDRSSVEEQMTQTAPDISRLDLEEPPVAPVQVGTPQEADFKPFGLVNLPLVQATCLSHAKLLAAGWTILSLALMANANTALDLSSLHWNGDMAAFHSLMDWSITPLRLVEGVLATMPLVALSSMIGSSDNSEFCPVHFSVTNTVISLFGRRRQEGQEEGTSTLTVLLFSLGIATVSALSEELIFRGLLPTTLGAYTHSVEVALLGQALLFGMGQIRRKSSITENGVFSLMQWMNGLWYGTVYLGTGGDILPVLVAHVLYECHIFVGAWKMVNDQLDYTEQTCSSSNVETSSPSEQLEFDAIRKAAGGSLKPETLNFCRRFFYAFDSDHQGSLSLADVKRAVAFAFLQDSVKPSDAKTTAAFDEIIQRRPDPTDEEEDRVTLSEFLRLLFALKSTTWNKQLA